MMGETPQTVYRALGSAVQIWTSASPPDDKVPGETGSGEPNRMGHTLCSAKAAASALQWLIHLLWTLKQPIEVAASESTDYLSPSLLITQLPLL